MPSIGGYNPNNTHISANTLKEFEIGAITGKLTEVPGIGPAYEVLLKEAGIDTTYQLFGKYLMLRGGEVEPVELADRFYFWLGHIGITCTRANVVLAVASKLSLSFPDLYDPLAYLKIEAEAIGNQLQNPTGK